MRERVLCTLRDKWPHSGTRIDDLRDDPKILATMENVFLYRDETENSMTWVQIIPYVVVTCDGKIAVYRRGDEKEERLYQYKSIGFGGHINPEDARDTLVDTLEAAALRELGEEIGNYKFELSSPILVLRSSIDEVSRAHLGIVYTAKLPYLTDSLQNRFQWAARQEIAPQELEHWSRTVLEVANTNQVPAFLP